MPPAKFLPGTKSPDTPSVYTDAQWKAMDGVYQDARKLKYRAAWAERVNHAMLVDGSIVTDLTAIRAAAANQAPTEPGNLVEFEAHVAANRFFFIVDCDLVPRIYFQCDVPGNPDIEPED